MMTFNLIAIDITEEFESKIDIKHSGRIWLVSMYNPDDTTYHSEEVAPLQSVKHIDWFCEKDIVGTRTHLIIDIIWGYNYRYRHSRILKSAIKATRNSSQLILKYSKKGFKHEDDAFDYYTNNSKLGVMLPYRKRLLRKKYMFRGIIKAEEPKVEESTPTYQYLTQYGPFYFERKGFKRVENPEDDRPPIWKKIRQFHLLHVRKEVADLLGYTPLVWVDGRTIMVNAGSGQKGAEHASLIMENCSLECWTEVPERTRNGKPFYLPTTLIQDRPWEQKTEKEIFVVMKKRKRYLR